MNNLERMRASLNGGFVDSTPVFPIMIAPACQLVGVKQGIFSQDADVMVDTIIKARDLCDFDGIYVSRDNWVIHQALGGKIIFPEDNEPYGPNPVLESVADFKNLTVPDPANAPGMKFMLEAARKTVEKVGQRYYIQANTDSGAFSLAGILRGVQNFMEDLYTTDSKLIHEYLEFCTEVVIAYNKAMQKTGVHGIQYGDSIAGLISPKQYEEFAFPYQAKSFTALENPDCDLWIHICGKTEHIIPFVSKLNIQGYEVDALVDLRRARSLLGQQIAIKGNLDTTFLLAETPESIYSATQEMLKSSGFTTKFVASSGCGVPRMTPLENLRAMTRACREYALP